MGGVEQTILLDVAIADFFFFSSFFDIIFSAPAEDPPEWSRASSCRIWYST